MTTQPQINVDSPQNRSESAADNAADNAADTTASPEPERVPLDRSSPEWRRQFGALPSPQRPPSAPAAASPLRVGTAAKKPEKRSVGSFILGALAVIGAGSLIAYGYLPSLRKAEKASGQEAVKAVAESGSAVKKASAPRIRPMAATAPAAKPTPASSPLSALSATPRQTSVAAIKPALTVKRTLAVQPAPSESPRSSQTPNTRKPDAAPRPRHVSPKAPVVHAAPASPSAVAQAAPLLEKKAVRKPAPVEPVPVKAVQKPKVKPVLHPLPDPPPPHAEGIEPDGANPLDIPR